MTIVEMIQEFNDRFDIDKLVHQKIAGVLIAEEAREACDYLPQHDHATDAARAALAKELADIIYVVFLTGLVYGIDVEQAVRLVHQSNMTKLIDCDCCDGRGYALPENYPCTKCNGWGKYAERREDGKILKGPNYVPPDMTPALIGRS